MESITVSIGCAFGGGLSWQKRGLVGSTRAARPEGP
jgi:hypothetical protein